MRPTLNVISPALCAQVVAEAQRIMAASGLEIRGAALRLDLRHRGRSGDRRGRAGAARRDHLILSFFRAQGMRAGPSLQLELDDEEGPAS